MDHRARLEDRLWSSSLAWLCAASMRREAPVFLVGLVMQGLGRDRLELTRGPRPLLRNLVGLRHVARAEAQVDEASQLGGCQIQHIGIPPPAVQPGLAGHPAPEPWGLFLDLQYNAPGPSLAQIKTPSQSHLTLLNSFNHFKI